MDEGCEPSGRRGSGDRPAGRWPAGLAFGAGALASFASATMLGNFGVLIGWLVLTGLVLLGALVAVITRRTRQRPVALMLGWLAPPAFLFLVFSWLDGSLGDFFHSGSFDRETWIAKRGAEFGDRTRLRMVERLRASGSLDRLTQAEALDLLGPPDRWSRGDDARAWVWRLGPDRGIGIDSSHLLLRFGPDDRVASHDVVED